MEREIPRYILEQELADLDMLLGEPPENVDEDAWVASITRHKAIITKRLAQLGASPYEK